MGWTRFAVALLLLAGAARAEERPLVLATTTSVRDSGLMDELLPVFEKETGIQVQLVAVGSGAALAMGEKGDADVLVTHDPDAEQTLVEKGALVDHRAFLENYYLIAGPAEDPVKAGAYQGMGGTFYSLGATFAPLVITSTALGLGLPGWGILAAMFLLSALGMTAIALRAASPRPVRA